MKPKICDKNTSFSDCELLILRLQVDESDKKQKRKVRVEHSAELNDLISILEDYLKRKKNVCYGGIAINALLPENAKIYNEDDIPDYDFFSSDALNDAKELVDIYINKGYKDVEAKTGKHHGTFKVFVNFQAMADITNVPNGLFNVLKRKSVNVGGILYTDANFLRMSMYSELSKPAGDTSRWEKVFKRLRLINKYYPIPNSNCNKIDFQRKMEDSNRETEIYEVVKNTLIDNNVVFFGGFAMEQYAKYMPKNINKQVNKIADFDVLSLDPLQTANIVKKELNSNGINNVIISKKTAIGEIIPLNYEIKVGADTIAFIYKPLGCHSYNVIKLNSKEIKIATIDTMLSFYLAFTYANKPYYDITRILCMSNFLFEVQKENRLEQKGVLKRFSIDCYGVQPKLEDIMREKADKFDELKDKKETKEYEEWFLKYNGNKNTKYTFKTPMKYDKYTKSNRNKYDKYTKYNRNKYDKYHKYTKSNRNKYRKSKTIKKKGFFW